MWPYLSPIIVVVIGLIGVLKDWKAHRPVARWMLVTATVAGCVVSWFLSTTSQLEARRARGRIVGLEQAVKSAEQTIKANSEASQKMLGQMIDKISNLQAKVSTEELQKELKTTKLELIATQHALTPERKASLLFSLAKVPKGAPPLRETTAIRRGNNVVSMQFTVGNSTDVPALDPAYWIRICTGCKFAKEMPCFYGVEGAFAEERHCSSAATVWPDTFTGLQEIAIEVPPGMQRFGIAFRYGCRTCLPTTEWQNAWVNVRTLNIKQPLLYKPDK